MDWWFFSFLRWTIVPTARLPPALTALSGCLLYINSQLLPVKFQCPTHLRPHSLQFLPRSLTQLFAYFEKLLQISSFCQLSLELLAMCRGRERVGIFFTGSHGKNWNLYAIYAVASNLTHWWFLIKIFFPWWGRDFLFPFGAWEVGALPLLLMAIFEAKKAGNAGTFHLARALE